MRKQAALRILAGIIPVCLCGCGNSRTPADDAARSMGGSVAESTGRAAEVDGSATGTGGGAAGASSGGTGSSVKTSVGGASAGDTGMGGTMASSAGASKTGGAVTTSSGGPGGTLSGGGSSAGGRAGGTGGSITGGTATAGGTVAGGSTGSGGTTGTGGATGTGAFPPRFAGNLDTYGSIRKDFATYWNQFTPENAGKWMSVQGESKDKFNWASLDTMYKTCEEQGILFKEHTFIWGAPSPIWMSFDSTTGPAAVKNWMKSFCERYPKTRLIDVVNEPPPHTTPRYVDAIGGGNRTTWDWIANAFKWAREACPNAILILNDYDNLERDASVQNTIDIVTAIQKLGAPIDAIGCETHGADKLPASTLRANIDKIVAATGLPVYITEYDIGLADDEAQKAQVQDHFTMFWDHPSVKGVTVWGYITGTTWRSSTGLMSSDGTMRPAMTWLMEFLKR